MKIVLFDDSARESLLPLTFTRPVASLRIGILTIAEKWERYLKAEASYLTAEYLQHKFPYHFHRQNIFINGSVCPDDQLLEAIDNLKAGEALYSQNVLLAAKDSSPEELHNRPALKIVDYSTDFIRIVYPEDIFRFNDAELRKDFLLVTKGRSSASLSTTNTLLGDQIFVEPGANAECTIFNTKEGPIYLGSNSNVLEGSVIRGSFALCENGLVKMGAKIYGKTTVGPHCKVGGEVNNSVLYSNSSKGHEGFLGNSVLGEWCNIGADTNNSNLKNNYAEVKLWDYNKKRFRKTGLQFCGLIMADHAKCGINTMFNTGTVVGVSANVFGAGYPRNFVPDFAWGGAQGFEVYNLNKVFETAEKVFERRGITFGEDDQKILNEVFELTKSYRNF
ncbi:GlmU family protein [Pedobacter sp. SYSU D00535]|uniref:GlmU family protein n=1 Tax=Pedobacter sp. SYSU D00535 TaxID=2810308 RepID=UPI001A97313B|nr:GlmU family protein [Pedobacter sp. SYSU D00535]